MICISIVKILLEYYSGIRSKNWTSVCVFGTYLATYVGQSVSCLFVLFAEHWCAVCTVCDYSVYSWVPLESWLLHFSRCSHWACLYSRHVFYRGFNRCSRQLDSSAHRCGHFALGTGKSSIQAISSARVPSFLDWSIIILHGYCL